MTPQAGRLRILVVDDEPAILRFLRVSLESRGYAVATAPNGRTALDLILETRPILSSSTSIFPTWMVSMS